MYYSESKDIGDTIAAYALKDGASVFGSGEIYMRYRPEIRNVYNWYECGSG